MQPGGLAMWSVNGTSSKRRMFAPAVKPRTCGPIRSSPHRFMVILLALILGTVVVLSNGRRFWSDEIFGWILVTDSSLLHMLKAWGAGADGGGLLFYMLARLWLLFFPHSELSFRLYAGSLSAAAALVTYRSGLTIARASAAFTAVTLVWFSSSSILEQLGQARPYGLLLLGVSSSIHFSLVFRRKNVLCTADYFKLSFSHAILAGSHPVGVVYSLLLILAVTMAVRMQSRLLLKYYIATFGGTATVTVLSGAAIYHSALIGKPFFWPAQPSLKDLLLVACGSSSVTVVAILITLVIRRWLRHEPTSGSSVGVVLWILTLFELVPLIDFCVSRQGNSFFVSRYFVPLTIPLALILASTLNSALFGDSNRITQIAVPALACFSAIVNVAVFRHSFQITGGEELSELNRLEARPLPTVVSRFDVFDVLVLYDRATSGHEWIYPLDWNLAVSPLSPRTQISGYRTMDIWRDYGYFSPHIQCYTSFKEQHASFYVLEDNSTAWFDVNIRGQHEFKYLYIGLIEDKVRGSEMRLWLLDRFP